MVKGTLVIDGTQSLRRQGWSVCDEFGKVGRA